MVIGIFVKNKTTDANNRKKYLITKMAFYVFGHLFNNEPL